MATPAVRDLSAQANLLELETLQLLPCGCVTSIGRVPSWDFLVVAIEAKGPHCNLTAHRLGRMVVSDRAALGEDDEDELAAG